MTPHQLLAALPHVWDQLTDALVPGQGGGNGERVSGGGGDERPAPAQLHVIEHRDQLRRGLDYWRARVTAALRRRPHTLPDAPGANPAAERPSVYQSAAWLYAALALLDHDDQVELSDNLRGWHARAARMLDAPAVRARLPLPTACMASTDLWRCEGQVQLVIPAGQGEVRPWVACDDCRGRWSVAELPTVADAVLPVHEAAAIAGVSVSTVKRRASRDSGLVRLGDVFDPAQHRNALIAH